MDWAGARERDRRRKTYEPAPYKDDGRIALPDGRWVKVGAIVDLEQITKQCTNCGARKNGHHFTTWPGRKRGICASCVAALGLPQTEPEPGPNGRRPRLPRARNLPHGGATRTKRTTGATPTGRPREITAQRPGRCSVCSRTVHVDERTGWDPATNLLTCRHCL